jgi:hypothetical protein
VIQFAAEPGGVGIVGGGAQSCEERVYVSRAGAGCDGDGARRWRSSRRRSPSASTATTG